MSAAQSSGAAATRGRGGQWDARRPRGRRSRGGVRPRGRPTKRGRTGARGAATWAGVTRVEVDVAWRLSRKLFGRQATPGGGGRRVRVVLCARCRHTAPQDTLLFCDRCDKGIHMDCLTPPLREKPTGRWICSCCEVELASKDSGKRGTVNINNNNTKPRVKHTANISGLLTPGESPTDSLSPVSSCFGSDDIPDASQWSMDEVVKHFVSQGFDNSTAEVFRTNCIDGSALLLLKRDDILNSLELKLGPALKVHRHVCRLQLRGSGARVPPDIFNMFCANGLN